MEEAIVLTPLMVKNPADPEGPEIPSSKVFSILNGRYRLWYDEFSDKVRWSLVPFPDDGLGIPTHGSCRNVRYAALACVENQKLRGEVSRDNPERSHSR